MSVAISRRFFWLMGNQTSILLFSIKTQHFFLVEPIKYFPVLFRPSLQLTYSTGVNFSIHKWRKFQLLIVVSSFIRTINALKIILGGGRLTVISIICTILSFGVWSKREWQILMFKKYWRIQTLVKKTRYFFRSLGLITIISNKFIEGAPFWCMLMKKSKFNNKSKKKSSKQCKSWKSKRNK